MTDVPDDPSHEHDFPDHVWVRIMMMPVEVTVDPESPEGHPLVMMRESAIRNLVNDGDQRIGCLVCNTSLDEGWGTPCPGPQVQEVVE